MAHTRRLSRLSVPTTLVVLALASGAAAADSSAPWHQTWTSNMTPDEAKGAALEDIHITGVVQPGLKPQWAALNKDTIQGEKARTGVFTNYTPPEVGIKPFLEDAVAFAVAIGPLDVVSLNRAADSHGGVAEIPIFLGTVGIFFNLPGVSRMTLDGRTAAKVFSGEITKWDDGRIQALNEGVKLPSEDIRLIVRKDNSSQTASVSGWFNRTHDAWALGVGKQLDFPESAIRAEGSAETFGFLSNTTYSISYAEVWAATNYTNSHDNKFAEAALINNRGNAVTSASASYEVTYPWPKAGEAWTNVSTTKMNDKKLHPLTYITYVYVSRDLTNNGTVGAAIKQMVGFLLSDGVQSKIEKVYRAHPLPDDLLKAALLNWADIEADEFPQVGWQQPDMAQYTSERKRSRRRRRYLL